MPNIINQKKQRSKNKKRLEKIFKNFRTSPTEFQEQCPGYQQIPH